MKMIHGRQFLGARERQEDAFRIIAHDAADIGTDLLILLSDGMGGHVGDDIAARLVVDVFEDQYIRRSRNAKPAPRMIEALEAANAALRDRIQSQPDLAGMGATLVAAMKLGSRLHWLSVGDSVLYLLRDGKLTQLNADHSVYGELIVHVREGRMTQHEADNHPRRNALRSAIIGEKIALIDTNVIALQPRDVILVASDGLDTLSDQRIADILSRPDRSDPQAMTADLLTAIEAAGRPRQDNATVVVYRYDPTATATGWSNSMFRDASARSGPLGLPWVGVAAMAAVLALGTLVYAIGWGGRATVPPIAPSGAPSVAEPAPPGGSAVPAPRSATPILDPDQAPPVAPPADVIPPDLPPADAPAPEAIAPETPAPETPAPETPAPDVVAPDVPAPAPDARPRPTRPPDTGRDGGTVVPPPARIIPAPPPAEGGDAADRAPAPAPGLIQPLPPVGSPTAPGASGTAIPDPASADRIIAPD